MPRLNEQNDTADVRMLAGHKLDREYTILIIHEAVQRNTTCEVWHRWHRSHLRNCLLQRPRVAREIACISRSFASGCSCRSQACRSCTGSTQTQCEYSVNSALRIAAYNGNGAFRCTQIHFEARRHSHAAEFKTMPDLNADKAGPAPPGDVTCQSQT